MPRNLSVNCRLLVRVSVLVVLISRCTGQLVRVTVDGVDLSTDDAGDCVFAGGADPRWRVRFSIDSGSTFTNWNEDRDNIGNSGYQGISQDNLLVDASTTPTASFVLQLDAFEDDNAFCGGNDGVCGGYAGGDNGSPGAIAFASRTCGQPHEIEIIRNCDGTEWRAKVRFEYEYDHFTVRNCNPQAPTFAPTSLSPTRAPSNKPTKNPTRSPTTLDPTAAPVPTPEPTDSPTISPTPYPTGFPSTAPTKSPSISPTKSPVPPTPPTTTETPTATPTSAPTKSPTTPLSVESLSLIAFLGIAGGGVVAVLGLFVFLYRRRSTSGERAMNLLDEKRVLFGTSISGTGSSKVQATNPLYGGNRTKSSGGPISVSSGSKFHSTKPLQNLVIPGLGMPFNRDSMKSNLSEASEIFDQFILMNVVADFEPENDDELGAKKGGKVQVTAMVNEDWAYAYNPDTGQSGMIPKQHLLLADEGEVQQHRESMTQSPTV